MATFYDEVERPLIADYIYGLGGRDASPKLLRGIYESLLDIKEKGSISTKVNYMGVRT